MTSNPGSSKDLIDLQENLNKQQAKISALKELVRKSESAHGTSTSSTQEKVKNIAQRLNHLKAKSRLRQSFEKSSVSEIRDDAIMEESSRIEVSSFADNSGASHDIRTRSETPGSEKVQLLRQKTEQNKLKMAEREHNKREIEEMVIQLKARMDSTQQSLERSSELGRSMGDLSILSSATTREKFKSSTDLSFTPLNLDKERIKFLENRIHHLEKETREEKPEPTRSDDNETIKALENKVLDLEENLREKESIIEARTKAVSLLTENLTLKGKSTVDTLEDTRQEMFKMQNSFVETENSLRLEILNLQNQVKEKDCTIKNLEEVSDILETTRFDLTCENAELEGKMKDVQDYSTKLSELNKLNQNLQRRISDLESQKYEFVPSEEGEHTKPHNVDYSNIVQPLNNRIKELEIENDDLKKLAQEFQKSSESTTSDEQILSLQATINAQREEIKILQVANGDLEERMSEKVVEYNVLNANFSVLQEKFKASLPKSLFSKSTDEEADMEITRLKSQLDESNKSMIKIKLKTKQLQKQIESFKKLSVDDCHGEVIRLNQQNQQFQQKITELEDEKGSLQLKLVSGTIASGSDDTELLNKIQILETTCQNQTSAIQLLEEQKIDIAENLQKTKLELSSLREPIQFVDKEETDRVSHQMGFVQLEEQYDENLNKLEELTDEIERFKVENEGLRENINQIEKEKSELSKKVEHYVAENVELLDKIGKISKSSSSAESIEIVERLTHQEKLEIEAFNQKLEDQHTTSVAPNLNMQIEDDNDCNAIGQELSDSLVKLREESSELKHKVDLFTTERREVLEKMEILSYENHEHLKRIGEITDEKLLLNKDFQSLQAEKEDLTAELERSLEEKNSLLENIKEIGNQKDEISSQLKLLQEEKDSATAYIYIRKSSGFSASQESLEICERSLSKLYNELENYRKSNDKNSKLNTSKKLAKEAKNVHQQLGELVQKIKDALAKESDSISQEEEDKYEQLRQETLELKKTIVTLQEDLGIKNSEISSSKDVIEIKNEEIETLNEKINSMQKLTLEFDKTLSEKCENYDHKIRHLEHFRKDLDIKITTGENEIGILKALVAEQKHQIIEAYSEHEVEMASKIQEVKQCEDKIAILQTQLADIQSKKSEHCDNYVQDLQKEVKKLESLLGENKQLLTEQNNDLVHKQETIETLNAQLMELYRTMEENSNKIIEKEEEVNSLQSLLEENKSQINVLNREIEDNKFVTEKLLIELHSDLKKPSEQVSLDKIVTENKQLDAKNKELERSNADLTNKNKEQLDKLKKFAANLKKKVIQCNQMEEKLRELEKDDQNKKISAPEQQAEARLMKANEALESEEIKSKYELLIKENNENKTQYECMRNELDKVNSYLENLQMQITDKDKELDIQKHNSSHCQNINHKLEEQLEFVQNSLHEKTLDIDQKQDKLKTIADELDSKNLKFEKCKAVIKEKNREIQRLKGERDSVLEKLSKNEHETQQHAKQSNTAEENYIKLKQDHNHLRQTYESEKATFQETILRLETLHDGIQAKLQEDMGYIETLEAENNKFKDKILKLETFMATFEERRASLENQTSLLGAQLQSKASEYEQNEDALISRLTMVAEHDDIIGKRLVEAQEENHNLSEKVELLKVENGELKVRIAKIENDSTSQRKYEALESEKETILEQLNSLQKEFTRVQTNYETCLANKNAELDDLENDLSVQLKKIQAERRSLQESLEKATDELSELKDETVRLREYCNSLEQTKNDLEREMTWVKMQNDNMTQDQIDLQELRIQMIQDKNEIETQKHQTEALVQNHEIELNTLRTQIAELDSMRMQVGQNQTDDQVFIETENKKLKELLSEKEAAIESYQRQNLQLQMGNPNLQFQMGNANDPFSTLLDIGQSPSVSDRTENVELKLLREKIQKLEHDLCELQANTNKKDDHLSRTLKDLNETRQELKHTNANNSDLQKLCLERQNEVSILKTELERLRNPPSGEVASHLFPEQSTSSIFDDIISVRHIQTLEGGNSHQKKIEDLERNVSDLEKYATDLEIKLNNLTSIHEETILQTQEKTRQYEETIKQLKQRIQGLEEKQKEEDARKNVESLVIQSLEEPSVPSLNKFFDTHSTNLSSSMDFEKLIKNPTSDSVVEEVIVPKKMYICQPGPDKLDIDAADFVESGGWGSEEAILEENHQRQFANQNFSLLNPTAGLELKLKEYQERVQELEVERNNLNEKLTESQMKTTKLLRKLKEYKTINDQLTTSQNLFKKSPSVESSDDLDVAIQNEMKIQVKILEQKLMETRRKSDKAALEKDNLVKRVDVLTAANDRLTEMKEKQDIEVQTCQSKIRQLSQNLQKLEDWSQTSEPTASTTIPNKTIEKGEFEFTEEWKQKQDEYLHEIEELKLDRDELQALLDEEKENVRASDNKIRGLESKLNSIENGIAQENLNQKSMDETIKKLEKHEKQYAELLGELANKETDVSNLKLKNQDLLLQLADYKTTIEQLSTESKSIASHLNLLHEEHKKKLDENTNLTKELQTWISKSHDLAKEMETMRTNNSQDAGCKISLEELSCQIQYKDAEIMHLKQRVEDLVREDQTQPLVQEILGKNQEINDLRQQVQLYHAEKMQIESQLILQSTQQNTQKLDTCDDVKDMQEKVKYLENQVQSAKIEKENMEKELEVLNNHVVASLELEDRMKQTVLEVDMKNIEIEELKKSLEMVKMKTIGTEIQDVQKENQIKTNEIISQEAVSWKRLLEDKENEFKIIEEGLRQKIDELIKTNNISEETAQVKIQESNDKEHESELYHKMEAALESQELEIVTLKEQLALRSADYARLAAQYDPFAMAHGQTTSSSLTLDSRSEKRLSSALYMLHQRDMKCEELSLELLNLLDERDTLQLKLSNSIRQMEDIKRKTGYSESGSESDQGPSNTNSPEKLRTRSSGDIGTNDDQTKDNVNLTAKISQLHIASQTKEQRLWGNQDHIERQMERIQQDVANIPSEAVSELVGTDFSNTTQSPSSVLLSWFWGKNNLQS